MKKAIGIYVLTLLLTACAMNSAPSLQESIAAGYITIETLAEAALAANESGQLSDADRTHARSFLQAGKYGLDLARDFLEAGDRSNALIQLTSAFQYFESVRLLMGDSS